MGRGVASWKPSRLSKKKNRTPFTQTDSLQHQQQPITAPYTVGDKSRQISFKYYSLKMPFNIILQITSG